MELAINFVFDMLAFTAIMVLVVMGLGVIASMMGIFNFAHGEFLLLGAYTVYLSGQYGLPIWVGILLAPFSVGLVGFILERTIVWRFYATPVIAMLGTYAVGLVIREIVRGLIGGHFHNVPAPIAGFVSLGGMMFPAWRVVIILVAIGVTLGAWLFLTRSAWGLMVRAALENPSLARASGTSTTRLYALTFAFGAALAGLAGAMMVPLFSLFADLGVRFLVQGFLSVMLGGVGTFEGPVLGSAVIGGLVAGLPWVVLPVLADVLVFVIALVIVKLRPQGFITRGRL